MMITMKKSFFSFAVLILVGANLIGCKNKPVDINNDTKVDSVIVENDTTYLSAINYYLVNEIGKNYSSGKYCVPSYSIVAVNESNANSILVWGDFWVFNYNLAGDTLKTVSGGSHPGLIYICKTEKGYEVTRFDQVVDGAGNLESAKKIFGDKYDTFHAINSDEKKREQTRAEFLSDYVKKQNIKASMYQDEGWPAKKLP